MKLPDNKKFRWNYVGLAFALPTTLMLVMMFITSVEPFGNNTMLYSDMYHQYYPFFVEFREALRSGDSLLWSWSVGLGMDYLGLISYYLASPLNLLSVLVPECWLLEYFSLLLPIKLGLAGGFFALMLKKLYGQDDLALPLFGALYAMCAWALGYQWNIMWLDTFALLPLLMLGTVYLLRDKKYILYTVSLFLSVFSNYYVGFFACIFVLLFFFCYEICRFRGLWRFICDLLRIGFFTVLAIGMTAILELPTLAALQDTYSSVNQFPEGFSTNIITTDPNVSGEAIAAAITAAKEAWQAFKTAKEAGEANFGLWWTAIKTSWTPVMAGMAQVAGQMGGGMVLTYVDGLPNLYCGVLSVALGFLFLLARNVKLRDKICCVFLLLFFMLSFIIRQLDYVWHGFHFTNQIPYRFSFLFSFVLLYMAYRAWLERENFRLWQIVLSGLLSAAIFLADSQKYTIVFYMVLNFSALTLYLLAMCYGNPKLVRVKKEEPPQQPEVEANPENVPQDLLADAVLAAETVQLEQETHSFLPEPQVRARQSAMLVAVLITLELVIHIINFAANFSMWDYDYPKGEKDAASMFAYLQEREAVLDFFRTEVTHPQTLNDGALNGYNGISTFTSSANVRTTQFMDALGYAGRNNWNRYCWAESSPVANLFLNLKYLVERDITRTDDSCVTVLHSYHGITLMENNYYLPLGFLTEKALADVDFSESNAFTLQNRIYKAAAGVIGNVWKPIAAADVEVIPGSGIHIKISNSSGYTSFDSKTQDTSLTYTYTITKAGYMCLDLTLYANKNFSVWHNGVRLYSEGYTLPVTMAVCEVKPGDQVDVIIECVAETSTAVQVKGYLMDMDVFQEGYAVLSASTLQLTEFSNTYISGIIDCDRDGLLYTSIPQCGNDRTERTVAEDGSIIKATTSPEGNWVVYVDGVRTDNVLVGNAMVAVELTQGVHTVEFRYENKAFKYGCAISIGCATIFGGIVLCQWLIRRKKQEQAQ